MPQGFCTFMTRINSENFSFKSHFEFNRSFSFHLGRLNQTHSLRQRREWSCYFKFPSAGLCSIFVSPSAAAALLASREAPSRVKAPGMKCIKEAFVDRKEWRKKKKEEGKNKSMAWKQWMGHEGIKWPRCPSETLISYSAQSRRAESNLR